MLAAQMLRLLRSAFGTSAWPKESLQAPKEEKKKYRNFLSYWQLDSPDEWHRKTQNNSVLDRVRARDCHEELSYV